MPLLHKCPDFAGSVTCLWRNPDAARGYSTGVSLHGHTSHSRESFDFVPRVFAKLPFGTRMLTEISEARRRRSGLTIAFERAFWRPPLPAQQAHELEAAQIEKLGLCPIVALSDHDDVEACADLHALGMAVPYALEWTVPFDGTIFHLGIFNLPPEQARSFGLAMNFYTARPDPGVLRDLLAEVDALPEALIVLNHPLCCELRMERAEHIALLRRFLEVHGACIHALELNGLQPASDNREVVRIADEIGKPVISGGDRHCLEPNATINLTNAASFEEFVNEVRRDQLSRVLFLPQYREAIATRYLEFIAQAVAPYPDLVGRTSWTDRVFYHHERDGLQSIRELAPDGIPPLPIRGLVAALSFVGTRRATLRMAFGRQGEVGA